MGTMSLVADSKEMARKAAGDPRVRATGASAVATSCLFGFGGGIVGMAVGGIGGAMVGLPFALFTFGLSIPISAMGGAAGFLGAGTTGYGVYSKRVEIHKAACDVAKFTKDKVSRAGVYIQANLPQSMTLASQSK